MGKLKLSIMGLALMATTHALAWKTAGDGTTYSLEKLSQIEEAQIYQYIDDDDGEVIYLIYANDTIAAGDRFVMDDGVTVQFDDEVTFVIEGEADFRLQHGSTFDSAFDGADYATPVGIYINNEVGTTEVENCTFYYVGLRNGSSKGMKLSHCAFYNNNGAIGQGALTLGNSTAPFEVRDCTFEYNAKAAICGAANYHNPLLIENCTFTCNGQNNGNTPQLNLTVADSVVIRGCTITGDPTKNMVGAIVVANLVGKTGDLKTVIEDNTITDNRFGIATYLWQTAVIRNNTLRDNNHETNPMNGGSGINVYDPYYTQITYIEGNHIEGSLWGITLVGGKEANLGRTDVDATDANYNPGRNTFRNNGNGGVLYDLYNNSSNTVYAQGNTWNVDEQTEENIETVVFHKNDDDKLGEVIFMPAGDTDGMAAVAAAHGDNRAYDLSGRRAAGHGKKLLIANGRKMVR